MLKCGKVSIVTDSPLVYLSLEHITYFDSRLQEFTLTHFESERKKESSQHIYARTSHTYNGIEIIALHSTRVLCTIYSFPDLFLCIQRISFDLANGRFQWHHRIHWTTFAIDLPNLILRKGDVQTHIGSFIQIAVADALHKSVWWAFEMFLYQWDRSRVLIQQI